MYEFIKDHCVRDGSVRVSEFIRALRKAGVSMPRTEVIAALSQRFRLSDISGQSWIIGLSLRRTRAQRFRMFLHDNCFFADGLSCKLSAIVRGASGIGLTRTEVIQHLQECGFQLSTANGAYVVCGLALREPEYAQ